MRSATREPRGPAMPGQSRADLQAKRRLWRQQRRVLILIGLAVIAVVLAAAILVLNAARTGAPGRAARPGVSATTHRAVGTAA